MRLVYLDEAGTTAKATWLTVAGVIVHGDQQWREADRRIVRLVEKYIPERDRPDFVFHATDIFHGSRYFDRNKPEWATREQRWPILAELAQIIADLELPVVAGVEARTDSFSGPAIPPNELTERLHMWSVANCLYWTDLWLAAFAPDELATVVHEDGAAAKPTIKRLVKAFRHPDELVERSGLSWAEAYGLPFDHIIDTVHFAEKTDARLLQLADLCAFMISREMQGREVCEPVMEIIGAQTAWGNALRPTSLPDVEGCGK